jgi:hypothetical protein
MRLLLTCALAASFAVSTQGMMSASGGGGGCGTSQVRNDPQPGAASFTCTTCGGTYAQAGNCPKCGLELVPKGAPSSKP